MIFGVGAEVLDCGIAVEGCPQEAQAGSIFVMLAALTVVANTCQFIREFVFNTNILIRIVPALLNFPQIISQNDLH